MPANTFDASTQDLTIPPGFLDGSTGTPEVLATTTQTSGGDAPGQGSSSSASTISLAAGAAGTIASVVIGMEMLPALLVGGAIALGSEYFQDPQGVSNDITDIEHGAGSAYNAATGAIKTGATLAEMALGVGAMYFLYEMFGKAKR